MSIKLKALFVEDKQDDADLLILYLNKAGYEVEYDIVCTEAGVKQKLQESDWDIVFSDYEMPGFSGLEALEIKNQLAPDIPFILVSGTVGEEIAVQSVLAGANDYLLKDNLTRLITSIDRELDSRRLRQEKVSQEAALNASEQKFEQLFRNSIDGIIITVHNKELISANPAACKILGYTEDELVGSSRVDIVDYEDPEVIQTYKERDEKGSFRGRLMMITKQGSKIPVEVSSQLYNVEGGLYQTSTIFRDITRVLESEEKLKESLKEKEVMLAEIHHRVKNNMAIVSGLLTLQADASDDPEVKSLLHQSISRIQSIASVHELLYSAESFSNINLSSYIKSLIHKISRNFTKDKNVEFNIDADDVTVSMTQAIPCGLIINELVTNALKHAFEEQNDGRITIHISQLGNNLHMQISDNGIGMENPEELIQSEKLGFTIINALVGQLKAEFQIKSEKGLSFTLDIPLTA